MVTVEHVHAANAHTLNHVSVIKGVKTMTLLKSLTPISLLTVQLLLGYVHDDN